MDECKKIKAYSDEIHSEGEDDLKCFENGYKYRLLDGLIVPPYVTPQRYALSRRLKTRTGDICYCSYPKSGSTWLAHILVLITRKGETPDQGTLRENLHWIESSWTYPRNESMLNDLPSPRIFKSHMPYNMALGGTPLHNPCKYVYIARNPKDVATSYYYFERDKSWSGHYSGSWADWINSFMFGNVQRGDWFNHVLGWWHHANNDNILFLKYEDLLLDFLGETRKLANFLGYSLNDNILKQIQEKTAYSNMKQNNFSNMNEIEGFEGFFRQGKIGSWKEQFNEEQLQSFEHLIETRLRNTGLEFIYD